MAKSRIRRGYEFKKTMKTNTTKAEFEQFNIENERNIPVSMKDYNNWVIWKVESNGNGRPTKVPYQSRYPKKRASSTDSNTWSTYTDTISAFQTSENESITGIGFVVTDTPFTAVDVDHCRDPETGKLDLIAQEVINTLLSYYEITPSRTGIRVYVKGKIPGKQRCRKGNVEIYSENRFFTVSGNSPPRFKDIMPREKELNEVYLKYIKKGKLEDDYIRDEDFNKLCGKSLLTDDEIINKVMVSRDKEEFYTLYHLGNISSYLSHSEADLALCNRLAWWSNRDPVVIDRLFRKSKLFREKWNRKGYRERTIREAIKWTSEVYTPLYNTTQAEIDSPSNTDKSNADQGLSYSTLHLPSSVEISRLEIKVEWVVKNLIPKESLTLLHSIGGVGKSYLMYQLAQSVAEGKPFFDLDIIKTNVYYIDFENPLPEIVDRIKKIGGSENLRIWHLRHNPMPVRLDTDEWMIYKTFPPGLFIIDSLRSSHLLDENSSKDASLIMGRYKEIRSLGSTVILIHHDNKGGGYRGSTAWFDLPDHILKFSRVKKVGSDEDEDPSEDFNPPIRLGLGGKSRFSSAMELKPMYFKFENNQLCLADDPDDEVLSKMAQLLDPEDPPNQSQFQKKVKDNLDIGKGKFRKYLQMGLDKNLWVPKKSKRGNKFEYFKVES